MSWFREKGREAQRYWSLSDYIVAISAAVAALGGATVVCCRTPSSPTHTRPWTTRA